MAETWFGRQFHVFKQFYEIWSWTECAGAKSTWFFGLTGGRWGPKWWPTCGPKWGLKLEHFWGRFFVFFRQLLGSILGQEWAKMRQDDSNEDIKSQVPKSIIFKKCDFTMGKQYFSRLGGSQEEYERFMKALKRHLKSFKTWKERVPKMEPK